MNTKEEKLLRAVEKLSTATVPGLSGVTGFEESDVKDWIEKATSEGLIAPRGDQYQTDYDDPDKSALYPSWGLTKRGVAAWTALGPPKFKDGFGEWLQSKL